MIASLAYADDTLAYAVSEEGEHSFRTGIAGERAVFRAALTGDQVLFLSRNPAAVRCCMTKARFSADWLDQLIAATEAAPTSGARH